MQPSGNPHLGNYLGAMRQHVDQQENNECIYFLANLHALTTVKNGDELRKHTLELAIDYLALGIDPEKTIFFKHGDVPEHSELTWIFDCITNMGLLERAHAWKDAQSKKLKDPTVGLFNYPILMAADILLYKPESIPVGKDQKQHIEIARDIAEKFNNIYGETFPLPQPSIKEEVETVIGTDGEKMSKSYKNTIDIFAEEKILKGQIMAIQTDSTPLEEPKDPNSCNVFKLYKLLASKEKSAELANKYRAGNFGYGHAKTELLNLILEHFQIAREKRKKLYKNIDYVNEVLKNGSIKARNIAAKTLDEVKEKTGLK